MTGLIALGTAGLLGWGVWSLLRPTRRFVFGRAGQERQESWRRLGRRFWRGVRARLGEETHRQLEALGWPVWQVAAFAGGVGSILAAVASQWLHAWSWALWPGWVWLAWKGAGWHIARAYREWQATMVGELPRLLTLLRVHLDLGRTVPDSLQAVLPHVRQPLRRELATTLVAMRAAGARMEAPAAALGRLAARVDRLEFRIVAQTLGDLWTVRLSGSALAPLEDLLAAARHRAALERAQMLDLVLTLAPGLGLMGMVLWLVGGWLLSSLHGLHLG
ncbi:MAG: hypothetical protein OWV35_05760 [Firmicutes bacterium]|nr:hypothetical protein [Bacillota bacterium]